MCAGDTLEQNLQVVFPLCLACGIGLVIFTNFQTLHLLWKYSSLQLIYEAEELSFPISEADRLVMTHKVWQNAA